jgi:hypothetical protein
MTERRQTRVTMTPRLQARLTVLVERLHLTGLPAERVSEVAAALDEVIIQIAAAEHGVHGREWVVALRTAQNVAPLLRDTCDLARSLGPAPDEPQMHRHPVQTTQALWIWLITQAELYCKLQLIHMGLALRDPGDEDDDDDTEMFDFTGHLGEELVRQVGLSEGVVLDVWRRDRYRLYRILYSNYSRLRAYTAARGWVEETDALDYMRRRARMHGLHYYVWGRDGSRDGVKPPGRPLWDRSAVLGRLLLDRFYWLTAGFGYRPLRAVLINSVVVTAFAYVYWQFHLLCIFYVQGGQNSVPQCQDVSFLQSLYFSALAFFLAAMGEILPHPLWGQVLLVLESIWGFLNVSVIIAVIINRQAGE